MRRPTPRQQAGELWRRLRHPFRVPQCLHNTSCLHCEDWECIDMDMAGCRNCGIVHDCQTQEQCRLEVDNCCSVCTITGYCVREQVYADSEFSENVMIVSSGSPRQNFVEYDTVFMHVHKILCSADAEACLETEKGRLAQRLQFHLNKILKEHKHRHRGLPNMVNVATTLAHRTRRIRLCPSAFDLQERTCIANIASKAITRLICALYKVYPVMFRLTRVDIVTVGLLYLMRSDLVLHNTTILPCIPRLTVLLPLESYLFPCFQIRCKSITEVENIVKMNLRSLNATQLQTLGMQGVDEVLFKVPGTRA